MKNKTLIPFNLQFFAEDGAENTQPQETTQGNDTNEDVTPSDKAEEKNANEQLQATLVELSKLKRQLDKVSSEAADYKRKYRETMTEQEKASAEKAEAEAKRQEEFEDMKRRLAINDLMNEYMDRRFPKDMAQKIATARFDGDNDTVNAIEKEMDEIKRKEWEAEFYKKMPEINAGIGGTKQVTKEQFDNMTLIEKSKLKRENEEEYKRLIAL